MADRAILFIDGNNWYHGLCQAGATDLMRLNYAKIAAKLVGPRQWLATHYYIGQVRQEDDTRLYADQRRFLARFQAQDQRHVVHFGRLEQRRVWDECAKRLKEYMANLRIRIDSTVRDDLLRLARSSNATVRVEKAVDVMLAVDLVIMAERNAYDTAYLLSADGDYTHAVDFVRRECGKKVFAASCSQGAQLARAVDSFIRVNTEWLAGCYD